MRLTPKTAVLSIIAAPFAFINLFLIVATPMSFVEALQNPKTISKVSNQHSVTPTPIAKPSVTPRTPVKDYGEEYAPEYKSPTSTSESVKKDESSNPETWTSSRPNAMVIRSTEVSSMLGEHKYSTLYRGQLIRLTGDRQGIKVGIEGEYVLFKATGYVDIADIKSINLLDQTP